MDFAVAVCDNSNQTCPFFPWAREMIHAGFPDPASFTGTDEEILEGFRKVRDEIFAWIDATFGSKEAGKH